MFEMPAAQLSPNFSFRSTGKHVRIYREGQEGYMSVTFDIGGVFDWNDDGGAYVLTLKEVKEAEPAGTLKDGTPGPNMTYGVFDFHMNVDGEQSDSVVELPYK